ncbi:hypothetical protein [Roseateles koreensis]|uniref:Proline-rich protein n=1 Tax=Roseateles koreensis TaxID=2987526 RepID=A0ABT5KS96_9BURK|nr:hypothetical protein [Roseateles koreensis]MDC8785727.1 hypothetical protein [Roseateles koreensis]
MLTQRFQRSPAGRVEVQARQLGLSRSARNLLLVLDATRPAGEWLGLVQGATEADLAQLLAHGLLTDTAAAAVTTTVTPATAEVLQTPARPEPFEATLPAEAAAPTQSGLGHAELYGFMTRHAKQYLGLIKGYRMVLEVERCADLAALRNMADRFVGEVQQAQGEVVAEQVRRALGMRA